jgi:hypothetical protein
VEAGQLLVIALAWVLVLAARRFKGTAMVRKTALYTIGSVSVFWTLSRLMAIAA